MYQVILANYNFTFINGDYFDDFATAKNYINSKIRDYQSNEFERIENVYVKDNDFSTEIRQMIGFQELKSIEKENCYIVLASYNRNKNRWDKAGLKYSEIGFPNYKLEECEFEYSSFGDILKLNLDSINSFTDIDSLKEFIIELFINNHTEPKATYNKIIYLRQKRTLEQVIKFCYDTILSSEKLKTS